MAGPSFFPLTLGNISFDAAFEGPDGWQEGLGDLGSKQMSVVKVFPGGVMTAQLQGSVPKEIPIKGKLISPNARSRSMQLQQLCDNGNLVTLSYTEWRFTGFVEEYTAHVKSPTEVWFTLLYRPLVNLSTFTDGATSIPNVDPNSAIVSNSQQTMQQQATAPSNGAKLPSSVQQGVNNLNTTISQSVQQNGGNTAALTGSVQATIQGQISSVLNLLAPLLNGSDPLVAAAAGELQATLTALNNVFSQNPSSSNLDTQTLVNPNLWLLASYYYGDPTKWPLIMNATNLQGFDQANIIDALPQGTYSLIIPPASGSTIAAPATVMTDALASAA